MSEAVGLAFGSRWELDLRAPLMPECALCREPIFQLMLFTSRLFEDRSCLMGGRVGR